jgi:hypothetical protein
MQHSIPDGWGGAGDMYFRCRDSIVAVHLLVDLRSGARARAFTCGQDGSVFCCQATATSVKQV